MSDLDQRVEPVAPAVKDLRRPADATDHAVDLRGPFFTTRQAAAYIPTKSVKAVYEWCRRNHVARRANGSIAKIDLDRVLRRKRQPRRMQAASLANLRKRA